MSASAPARFAFSRLTGFVAEQVRPVLGRVLPVSRSVERLYRACGIVQHVVKEPSSERHYAMVTRRDHDASHPSPVLFALHPYATEPELLLRSHFLPKHAVERRGWLLVVPVGTKDSLGQFCWNASAGCSGAGPRRSDDVAYLRAVLSDVGRRYVVDGRRVYALGVSNGAFMAHRWAHEPGGELRGIACIAGTGPGPDDPPSSPTEPVRVLQVHGKRDDVIRFDGGRGEHGRYASVPETLAAWRRHNGCDARAEASERRSLIFGATRVETWRSSRAVVQSWVAERGDHQLPFTRFAVSDMLDFLDGAH